MSKNFGSPCKKQMQNQSGQFFHAQVGKTSTEKNSPCKETIQYETIKRDHLEFEIIGKNEFETCMFKQRHHYVIHIKQEHYEK